MLEALAWCMPPLMLRATLSLAACITRPTESFMRYACPKPPAGDQERRDGGRVSAAPAEAGEPRA